MSSNEEKANMNEGQDTLTREEAEQIRASAKGTLYVSIAVVLVWLYGYNIVVNDMGPILAFFKVLDGINDLVIGEPGYFQGSSVLGAVWVISGADIIGLDREAFSSIFEKPDSTQSVYDMEIIALASLIGANEDGGFAESIAFVDHPDVGLHSWRLGSFESHALRSPFISGWSESNCSKSCGDFCQKHRDWHPCLVGSASSCRRHDGGGSVTNRAAHHR